MKGLFYAAAESESFSVVFNVEMKLTFLWPSFGETYMPIKIECFIFLFLIALHLVRSMPTAAAATIIVYFSNKQRDYFQN